MYQILPIEFNKQRILSTEQLAEIYETNSRRIAENFSRNKSKFTEGKHYFLLRGDELREFKGNYAKSVVAANVNKLYLWTERGANRHCKILDTDKAWEQFDNLEETYFRVKEMQPQIEDKKSERETILEIIKTLSDDPFKNEAIIRLIRLVDMPVYTNIERSHCMLTDNQFIKVLQDFIDKVGILKRTSEGLALDKKKLYEHFSCYGLKKMEVLNTIENLGLIPNSYDRTPVIKYNGRIIRAVVIKNLEGVV